MSTIAIDRVAAQAPSYGRKFSWLRVLSQLRFARLRRAIRTLRQQMRIRRQRRILRELPDYLLKDIGIGRGEIDMVAQALIVNPQVDPRYGLPQRPPSSTIPKVDTGFRKRSRSSNKMRKSRI